MTGKFKFFEHTADAKFQAYGETLEEAFSNAALAMFSIMVDTEKVEKNKEWKIKVEGKDKGSILYDFLEELLFLLDTEHMILNSVKEIKIIKDKKQYRLKAIIEGDTISDNHEMLGEVKAVTYNDMEIKEEENKTTVQVVVDL